MSPELSNVPAAAWALAAALGYLLGSIPFGWILALLSGAGDIRKVGSGNIGATNVLRTGRKGVAALTLLCDAGKGALAVILSAWLFGGTAMFVAGIAAVLGHLFPAWLGFKGGKGVATGCGVLLAASPMAGVLACGTWLVVAAAFRFSSLAALIAFALAPFYAWAISGKPFAFFAALVSAAVILRHRDNIARLRAGTEPRIGENG
ncbi:MAG TPA: glycerol-3-phosphate 1-O-acyltransferase PlsY [Alphaproteobacteria bacterium]|nr:glycerol-3-phosphate 1-O-acyltransferase PlsY [Alphaproteobacteria bacterium]